MFSCRCQQSPKLLAGVHLFTVMSNFICWETFSLLLSPFSRAVLTITIENIFFQCWMFHSQNLWFRFQISVNLPWCSAVGVFKKVSNCSLVFPVSPLFFGLRLSPIWSEEKIFIIPCSMKILREFYFADWRFLVVCGNKFLRFKMTEISAGN